VFLFCSYTVLLQLLFFLAAEMMSKLYLPRMTLHIALNVHTVCLFYKIIPSLFHATSIQATHNLQLCLDFLSTTIPLFPVLDYGASGIVNGEVSLWALLSVVYELCKHKKIGNNNTAASGGGNNRCGSNGRGRSVSPGSFVVINSLYIVCSFNVLLESLFFVHQHQRY